MSVQTKARRGAQALDERVPGWHNYVDTRPGRFRIVSTDRCVLGQLMRPGAPLQSCESIYDALVYVGADLYRHGFNGVPCSEFRRAWAREVRSRRRADETRRRDERVRDYCILRETALMLTAERQDRERISA